MTFHNETQKLTYLLFVDLLKYTPLSRYHLTHTIDRENREYWNLEIRNVHVTDQGHYSCVLTAIKPISKDISCQGCWYVTRLNRSREKKNDDDEKKNCCSFSGDLASHISKQDFRSHMIDYHSKFGLMSIDHLIRNMIVFFFFFLEGTRNPLLALRSTSDASSNNLQRRSKEEFLSTLSLRHHH